MSTWTPEAIRALGVTTDLPTLGKIFRVSRTRAYQMAHTGEWEQAGIRIVPLGSRYVVAVQSVLEVLGHGDAGPGTARLLPPPGCPAPVPPRQPAARDRGPVTRNVERSPAR